jgi:hypothetical protein
MKLHPLDQVQATCPTAEDPASSSAREPCILIGNNGLTSSPPSNPLHSRIRSPFSSLYIPKPCLQTARVSCSNLSSRSLSLLSKHSEIMSHARREPSVPEHIVATLKGREPTCLQISLRLYLRVDVSLGRWWW